MSINYNNWSDSQIETHFIKQYATNLVLYSQFVIGQLQLSVPVFSYLCRLKDQMRHCASFDALTLLSNSSHASEDIDELHIKQLADSSLYSEIYCEIISVDHFVWIVSDWAVPKD
ncbi:hypothetical protein AVEN_85715-1 [Araneus ventricosus]|uniref:Uncharacterized protein n=1 Tax=Araneus ventricosus TaxID=182803 RepID=A0A4Y2QKB2_ARAVE|nr:hypothetical protein AVEN_85715-1 [Araneus ventricosus]